MRSHLRGFFLLLIRATITYIASIKYTPSAVATVATFPPTRSASDAIIKARNIVPLSQRSIFGAILYLHATSAEGRTIASIKNTKCEFSRRAGVVSVI